MQLQSSAELEKVAWGEHHPTGYFHTHAGTAYGAAVDKPKNGVFAFPGNAFFKERGHVGESEVQIDDDHKGAVNVAGFVITKKEAEALGAG